MVRNIVVLSGNSHPRLAESVCNYLGISEGNQLLDKFSCGETRCEIKDSVRGKDVFIIQTGGGSVNDSLVELCIMISACKIGSAARITAVTPLFPYSRQPDIAYRRTGAPMSKSSVDITKDKYTYDSVPATPGPGIPKSGDLSSSTTDISRLLNKTKLSNELGSSTSLASLGEVSGRAHSESIVSDQGYFSADSDLVEERQSMCHAIDANRGYKRWVAQAGNLVADLLTCAGADQGDSEKPPCVMQCLTFERSVIALDLHDPQYQGFFDVPMDNLYARPLLQRYIQLHVPDYHDAVVVSPDAGGAKRATAIADGLGIDFALIHKERPPAKVINRQPAHMMLVGNVENRVCILVDDISDTAVTITRAARLLRRKGATSVYALITHGVFSGDAIARLNASDIDKVITTNSVPQDDHKAHCPKLEVLDIAPVFAEAIRRIHHGESISQLFQLDVSPHSAAVADKEKPRRSSGLHRLSHGLKRLGSIHDMLHSKKKPASRLKRSPSARSSQTSWEQLHML